MIKGQLISPILSASQKIKNLSLKNRPLNQEVINSYRRQRQKLINLAKEKNLRVKPININFAISDFFEKDDGGRLIETFFKIQIANINEAILAVKFCQENNLGVLPIGAKTSAIGLFEVYNQAITAGLDGIVGLQVQPINLSDKVYNNPNFITINNQDENFEVILSDNQAIAILKPKNVDEPYQLIAYAGVTVKDINLFLNQKLTSDRYFYRLMPDPTSISDAQLGGIISTGAQGGNRISADYDITKLSLIDANANLVELEGQEAKKIVGLNGCAGLVMQAQFVVSAFPKFEHGFYMPIGNLTEKPSNRWEALFLIQDLLKPFCEFKKQNSTVDFDTCIVTGIELLSFKGLTLVSNKEDSDFLQKIIKLNNDYEFGLFITFQSYLQIGDENIFKTDLFKKLVTESVTDLSYDEEDNFVCSKNKLFQKFRYLSQEELLELDKIRHAVPYHARDLARRMGGISESSDVNVQVMAKDFLERTKAYSKLSKIYANYHESFLPQDGFEAIVYGHMHPGSIIGGAINPHIRVIFELSNPGSRYNAPEQVAEIKKRKSKFEKELLALNGNYGIKIKEPEKSRFGSKEYWDWLCLYNFEEASSILKSTILYGSNKNHQPIFSFRIPRVLPDFIKLPKDYLSINDDHACFLVQQPVRSAIWQKTLKELHYFLHDKLKLSSRQYTFILESQDSINKTLEQNLIFTKAIERKLINSINSKESFDPKNVYEFSCKDILGAEAIKIVVLSHEHVLKASESKCIYLNFYSIWKHWPYQTTQTVPSFAIVTLLKFLTQELPRNNFKHQNQNKILAGTTPAKINPKIYQDLSVIPKFFDVNQSIAKLKALCGIPGDYRIKFYGSSTQIFNKLAREIADNKDSINVSLIHSDPYTDLVLNIFNSYNLPLSSIRLPWTTGEYSQLDFIADKLVDSFTKNLLEPRSNAKNLVIFSPHKTTTTVDVHPDRLIKKLEQNGLFLGKDYFLICDLTSSLGARDYAKFINPDNGELRVPFHGIISDLHHAFGLPVGCSFISLSQNLAKLLHGDLFDNATTSYEIYKRWLYLIENIEFESVVEREKKSYQNFRLLLGWLENHPDLICLVPNSIDQSPLILGIFSQVKNLAIARRFLKEIFGHQVDPGYGPFEKEAIRLYLANISLEELSTLLCCLDLILELPDVVLTRGENIPNVALREPHDPLSVLERLSEDLTVDDLIRNHAGLAWLYRLIKTFNANVSSLQKISLTDDDSTGEYKVKARIYADGQNLKEMIKILSLKDSESGLELTFHYEIFRDYEKHLRRRIMQKPDAIWQEDSNSYAIKLLLDKCKEQLKIISKILRKFVKGEYLDKDKGYIKAEFDQEGRVKWPIVA